MAKINKPSKAKLVVGLMYRNKEDYDKAVSVLVKKFGEIEDESALFKFKFTDYYEEEFGKDLFKKFVCFKNLIDMDELAGIKVYSNELEEKFVKDGKRTANIDPGYITKNQLIVASAKKKFHRIYLGKGVYAHLMLSFAEDKCIPFEWSYKDYTENKDFFIRVRNSL